MPAGRQVVQGSSPRVRGSPRAATTVIIFMGIIPAGAGLTREVVVAFLRLRDHPRGCGAHSYFIMTLESYRGSSPRVRGSLQTMLIAYLVDGIIPAGAGLTKSVDVAAFLEAGSSPRVRGSQKAVENGYTDSGIIPAGAGLTRRPAKGVIKWRDHPRGCGAHAVSSKRAATSPGSSPRVRGSRFGALDTKGYIGIIPAGAGLTVIGFLHGITARDHPRGCGAHHHPLVAELRQQGSSPRVRGSLPADAKAVGDAGIIPAGAGLTATGTTRRMPAWDHPRGCGAHTTRRTGRSTWSGSSPRVRGSLLMVDGHTQNGGIIPAGAGLTTVFIVKTPFYRDHPRGCGAHVTVLCLIFTTVGSSPRVRGSPIEGDAGSQNDGIIPAGAGLTFRIHRKDSASRDHPRGCGAHSRHVRMLSCTSGSSPRVRGSRSTSFISAWTSGIIPAGAGLTEFLVY